MQHSFLPPSGAAAWQRCALWPTMNARYPQDDTPSSIEGTQAHEVAWALYRGETVEISPTVTEEMIEAGQLVVDVIKERMAGGRVQIEQRVSMGEVHPDIFGTSDAFSYFPGKNHLEIVDNKYGHRYVEEYFNPQGILYALGIIDLLKEVINGNEEDMTISFTIVQPRCYYKGDPVRTHTYKLKDAIELIAALSKAAYAAKEPEPTATTNEHCIDCPGRHACPTLQKAAYQVAEFSTNRQPFDLTPQAAALELRMLERAKAQLDARVDGLQELTSNNIRRGDIIPYYHLESTKPRQQWKLPPEQIAALGELYNKTLAKPGVVTPLQAKKLGIDEAVISAYSFIPAGTLKLVADNPTDVAKVFGRPLKF